MYQCGILDISMAITIFRIVVRQFSTIVMSNIACVGYEKLLIHFLELSNQKKCMLCNTSEQLNF